MGPGGAHEAARLAGPIGEKNRYAQALVVLVPLGLALARTAARRTARALAGVATVGVLAGVALTYSRGAALALVVVLVAGTALRLLPLRVLGLTAAAVSVVLLSVPAYAERLSTLDQLSSSSAGALTSGDASIRGRATENLAALKVFAAHPLLGVGPGGFPTYYRSYAERVGGRPRQEERQAHNLYLGVAAELGIAGLTLLLTLFGVLLHGLLRARRLWARVDPARAELAGALTLSVLLYMATGVFLHLSYQRYFWLLVALAALAAVPPPRPTAVHRDPLRTVP
jgi:putative inorganic carbon (HCO3(-)) transporter